MGKVVEEAFDLTQESPDVTQADTTADEWNDLFKYVVPTGQAHVLRPEHTISMFLKNTSNTELNDVDQVKIEVRDATESDKKTVYGPTLYKTVQEFQDRDLMAKLQVREPVHIREKMIIAIMVKASADVDKDYSWFDLAMNRIRQGL